MREIKFRAWDVYAKQMLPVQDAKFVDGVLIGARGISWDNKVVVMQYTGLKDKNGKEIYEGDVVIERAGAHRSVVEFRDGAFQATHTHFDLSGNKTGEYEQPIGYLTDPVEVIGNIHETPELLSKPE